MMAPSGAWNFMPLVAISDVVEATLTPKVLAAVLARTVPLAGFFKP